MIELNTYISYVRKSFLIILLTTATTITRSQNIDSAYYYFDTGNYRKASDELLKVLPLVEHEFGSADTSIYSYLVFYTATSFEKISHYENAEKYFQIVRKIYETVNDLSNEVYLATIQHIAEIYNIAGNQDQAETVIKEVMGKIKVSKGRDSEEYLNILNRAAHHFFNAGSFNKAESFYDEALRLFIKIHGREFPGIEQIINNFGMVFHKEGKYDRAGDLYSEALRISGKAYGTEHPNTISIINNLGALYDDLGNYERAESLFMQALKIKKDIFGPEHPEYAVSANNLAQLYYKTGNFENAEQLYLLSLDITGKSEGENSAGFATILNNIGALYHGMASYEKAEYYYRRALRLRSDILGKTHPDYATTLGNIALLYCDIGDLETAETLLLQTAEIRHETTGTIHPDYAATLNNLALVYEEKGDYKKAEELLIEAVDVLDKSVGDEHPDYANTINNLSLLYSDSGNIEEAISCLQKALATVKRKLGERHPVYATLLNNMAGLYGLRGNFKTSEKMYLQALDILGMATGEDHPDLASVAGNLAMLYQENRNYTKAKPLYRMAMETYLSQIQQQFTYLSEREKAKYLDRILFFFMTYRNYILLQYKSDEEIAGEAYNIELVTKSLLLNADRQLRMVIINENDTGAIRKYDQWINLRATLGRQYSLSPEQRTMNIKEVEEQADELERQLTRLYSSHNEYNSGNHLKWQDVQKSLKDGEASVEFTRFPLFDGKKWSDTLIYVAMVLRPGFSFPAVIPLFAEKQLDTILYRERRSEVDYINELYSWTDEEKDVTGKGQRIYNILWKPLEKYLEGAEKIWYTPEGRLYQLSFAAIPCGENELLSDKYDLSELTSTARILSSQPERTIKNITLFGGIEFDESPEEMKNFSRFYQDSINYSDNLKTEAGDRGITGRGTWMYLDGTKDEVEKISKLATENGVEAVVLTGKEAVEESFKDLSGEGSPDIIHIATHGFFLPDPEEEIKRKHFYGLTDRTEKPDNMNSDPLMRSGLAFAGANNVRTGSPIHPGIDDGILTAYEVANMYLPNTELVVLSACETGLGDIKGSEGVFGLQRAFRIAGADNVLMSLWQIPDYQTYELMNHFYIEWLSGRSIDDAFSNAQDFMKTKYPGQPYMWAAFVLVR